MHDLPLVTTIAAAFASAWVLGLLTQKTGLSPIVGYLLAGIVIGPHTPGFVGDVHLADQLAEIGVILLMFGVGLHFRLKDLVAVRTIAIVGSIVQGTIAALLGVAVCVALGRSWSAGIIFGLALSVASTVVLTRVLGDNNKLQSPTGRIAIGWVVVEDIRTVFVLVLLPVVYGTSISSSTDALPLAIALATAKLIAFVALTLLA